ncbi:hypothetical protein [uncultured Brevundimonas sp.]|uniref:hypothetical protein n=1 Tax=uncultured Brevundimonas sp. TaxID=213418 RepID=UPI0025D29728|nr:hypothetical protein [uncultured Brevundimonas sp.]
MTATQAPTPGPLTSESVKLLVKLLDTLKPFAEVAEKLKHCHVVEICEPTPDNPSRNTIPMPREWFERAGDDLEYIAIQLHASGVLSEGQVSKITGLDRVSIRREVDSLAPTAPVEASGSEREDIQRWQADQSEFFQSNVLEVVTEYATWRDRQEALRPQPSGETREAGLSVEMVARFMAAGAAEILSLKNDNVTGAGGWASANWKLFVPQAERLRTAMTTPARAEAQDEGAAGSLGRALYEAFWKRNGGNEPAWCDQSSAIRNMWDAIADDARAIRAHPSPTPAADADRARAALVWIAEQASGVDPHKAAGMLQQIEAKALAALKSERQS